MIEALRTGSWLDRARVRRVATLSLLVSVITLGFRNIYGKTEVTKVDDIKGKKIRVQATKTEDTHFPAYGAQTVHMPFGEVYTSLQTGVINFAENGINVFLANKHYEVAPVLSITEHEPSSSIELCSVVRPSTLAPV